MLYVLVDEVGNEVVVVDYIVVHRDYRRVGLVVEGGEKLGVRADIAREPYFKSASFEEFE